MTPFQVPAILRRIFDESGSDVIIMPGHGPGDEIFVMKLAGLHLVAKNGIDAALKEMKN